MCKILEHELQKRVNVCFMTLRKNKQKKENKISYTKSSEQKLHVVSSGSPCPIKVCFFLATLPMHVSIYNSLSISFYINFPKKNYSCRRFKCGISN